MRRHITGIDHCIVLVRDLDQARASYERLGFTVAPRGLHSATQGTANHTIMLKEDYFELLGVLNPTANSAKWIDFLAGREGLAAVALRTDDAAGAAAELREGGIEASEPASFSRPVDLPDGGKSAAAFVTTHLPAESVPGLRLFCCQHLTREVTWLPSLTSHANTAYAIDHLLVVSAQPAAEAAALGRVFGTMPTTDGEGAVAVATGSAPVVFVGPEGLAARHRAADLAGAPEAGLAVLALKVRDIAAAAECLRRGKVGFTTTKGVLTVPPRETHGVVLAFRAM
jgi:catechol 2,3-dioxygenase-like lactoylglutathione lyase family enzyme